MKLVALSLLSLSVTLAAACSSASHDSSNGSNGSNQDSTDSGTEAHAQSQCPSVEPTLGTTCTAAQVCTYPSTTICEIVCDGAKWSSETPGCHNQATPDGGGPDATPDATSDAKGSEDADASVCPAAEPALGAPCTSATTCTFPSATICEMTCDGTAWIAETPGCHTLPPPPADAGPDASSCPASEPTFQSPCTVKEVCTYPSKTICEIVCDGTSWSAETPGCGIAISADGG